MVTRVVNGEHEWRCLGCVGFPHYEVSDCGQVRRKERRGKPLSPWVLRNGYLQVQLWHENQPRAFTVHRLVATAFLTAASADAVFVNHIDADKKNNCVRNLEWVTPAQNSAHAARMGLVARGTRNPKAKMNEGAVRELRERFEGGENSYELARSFGIAQSSALAIAKRKTWRHVL